MVINFQCPIFPWLKKLSVFLTFQPELIEHHGYKVEVHKVITDDGYILKLFRIPQGKFSNSSVKKEPVIVQHGLLSSSDDWLLHPAQENLRKIF